LARIAPSPLMSNGCMNKYINETLCDWQTVSLLLTTPNVWYWCMPTLNKTYLFIYLFIYPDTGWHVTSLYFRANYMSYSENQGELVYCWQVRRLNKIAYWKFSKLEGLFISFYLQTIFIIWKIYRHYRFKYYTTHKVEDDMHHIFRAL
jgi:hypothetical protein